ncbi:MAG: methyltransferase, partial [Patescibacteria group bacterium]
IYKNKDLSITYVHYYNSLLFAVIALARLYKKILKIGRGGDDEQIPNKILNKALQWIFSLERFWLPYASLPFGVSIICVIKKKI